jgi:hypothetical protein
LWEEKTSPTAPWTWASINDNDDVKILGLVFERDWWAYRKDKVVVSQYSGNSLIIRYRAKYTDDYYEILNGVDLSYLSNGNTYTGSNIKIYQDL